MGPEAKRGSCVQFFARRSYFWSVMWLHRYARNHHTGTQSDIKESVNAISTLRHVLVVVRRGDRLEMSIFAAFDMHTAPTSGDGWVCFCLLRLIIRGH